MRDWHPNAIRVVGRSAGAHIRTAEPKIVHHTTEGSSAAGAIAAYRSHGGWPHFTLEWTGGRLRVYQHLPLSQAARALQNPPGDGYETNRAKAVQIEHVDFAAASEDWPAARYAAIASLCRWIERQTGCPRRVMPGTKWGTDHPPRLSGRAFHHSAGHAGHQHVPGNSHWDPGQLRIELILNLDDSPHRTLRPGMTGPDIAALQQAIRTRARACARKDRMPTVDGDYGPRTERAAAFVAYILGVNTSQQKITANGLSEREQRWIRHPGKRPRRIKARAGTRRRKHCNPKKGSRR